MKIGKGIRYARKHAGLSQEGLANRCGISSTHISDLETGKANNPALKTIEGIAKACEVPPVIIYIAATDEADIDATKFLLQTKIDVAVNIFKS